MRVTLVNCVEYFLWLNCIKEFVNVIVWRMYTLSPLFEVFMLEVVWLLEFDKKIEMLLKFT
jgi:hypothetical protein